jgi:uncharacterized protein (TIGR02466 family)
MNKPATDTADTYTAKLPLVAVKAPDFEILNERLSDYLLNMSSVVPDRGSNADNGISYFENKWLSKSQLHKSNNTDLQKLVAFAEHTVNRMFRSPDPGMAVSIASMWGMISKSGLTGVRHNHAGRVSGAYYVDAGSSGETDGGLIEFYLKAGNAQPTHRFKPESGQLLLFPSTLEHSVSSYKGANPRIVIALNLT